MPHVNMQSLAGKLSKQCRDALHAAAGMCLSKTNFDVELEHWFVKLLETDNGDMQLILQRFEAEPGRAIRELTKALDGFRTGNNKAPALSKEVMDAMREAWSIASLEFGVAKIRSGHLLAAVLNDLSMSQRLKSSSKELSKVPAEQLVLEFRKIVEGSVESREEQSLGTAGAGAAPGEPGHVAADSKTPALDQFTQNLTAAAKAGKMDPVIGRDFEIRQVIDILTRRRQNNPILVGEAGVGKTAVVEGFALRIAAGDVPEPLKNVSLRTLDLGLLQAGAGVKGEFENRLKEVIKEVQSSPTPVILFIDEAHTLIGAGGQAGTGDAANLLKPALARGELRTVAATTFAEYKKSFEEDPALKRRFQPVKVDEPDRPRAVGMMRGISGMLEKHHKVAILDEALEEAVRLSQRYITDRQLPDKSVSLLDTACARVALSQTTTPALLEDTRREIDALNVSIGILQREEQVGLNHQERLTESKEKLEAAKTRLTDLEKRWGQERELVLKIQALRDKLIPAKADAPKLSPEDEGKARKELEGLQAELAKLQGETPLVQQVVNGQVVAEVVAGWTGVPLGKMVRNEIQSMLELAERLKARIVGQDHALEALSRRIRSSRAGLVDPRKPVGVFMMVGPSGTGKTETALALSDILFGGDRGLTIINMSEYKADMMVSRLTGPAPGLVGYGKGGVLTEAVRRKPYSVVLLDEIEKANPAVWELFYQVFDKGMLQDEKGQEADFKNTVILMTSNVGTDTIMKHCADPDTRPDPAGLNDVLRNDLLAKFPPAFLGRLDVIPFYPLTDDVLKGIIKLKMKQVGNRVRENHKADFAFDEAVVNAIASRCKEVESGARNVDQIISGTLLPELSKEILTKMVDGQPMGRVTVKADAAGGFAYEVG
ncbi:MAG: type VI secretion system ATPase TssH [Gemmataceae bacterium]